ncbi:MAG: glycosyltransferase family 4 protein [Dermatophilus congolensis]|nr:glycosyltransferase family 4 protein [Dermatophilus congolensis]
MKILLVAINYAPEPTGIAPYVEGLAQGLVASGHKVRVITGIPHYPQWTNYTGFRGWRRTSRIDGVTVTRVNHVVPHGGIGIGRVFMELSFGLGVIACRWGRPDVVLTVSPPLIASAMVIARARLSKIPSAVWSQDLYTRGMAELDSGDSWKVRAAKFVEGSVYRGASGVVAIGERFLAFAVSELGVPAQRVSVHGNWSHVETATAGESSAFRQRIGWGDRPVFMHSGAMGNKQGLEVVVEAALLAEQRGSDALFVLTGDGSERKRLEKLAGRCANIAFLDPLPDDDFRAALAAADVLILNEKRGVSEMAIPSKLSTYFQAGRPVIAAVSPIGAAAGMLQEANAGLLIEPGRPELLLDEALRLAADAEASAAYGAAGLDFAHTRLGAAPAVAGIGTYLGDLAGLNGPIVSSISGLDARAETEKTTQGVDARP